MLKNRKVDATKGALIPLIIAYAVPLILSTLIQTLFNAVDTVVLGNMADSTAVASVGATSSIVHLLISTFVGIASGLKIIMARYFGARNRSAIKRSADTALLTAFGLGILIALVGILSAPWFLRMTGCPADCYEGALLYIRIYVGAAPAIMVYNFGSSIITSAGDTQRPLYYIIAGGFLNVILNIILCLILPQKVIAVAVATAAAQVLSAFLVLYRLSHMDGDGRVDLRCMRFHWASFGEMMRYGLPLALSTALYPISNLQIQTAINSYGVSAVAGSSAAATLEGIPSAFNGAFASTATVFMGQNIGARQLGRVRQSARYCLTLGVVVTEIVGALLFLSGRFWLGLVLPSDPLAVDYAMIRMFFLMAFYGIAAANGVLGHAIQSYGYPLYSTLSSIAFVFGFRIIWMTWVYPAFPSFHLLMVCFTVSWSLLMLCNIVSYFIFRRTFEKRWHDGEREESLKPVTEG